MNWWQRWEPANRRRRNTSGCCATRQLVTARVDAQHRFYRIQPEPLLEIDTWLAPYRALWESSLDALELHLEHMAVEGNPPPPGSDTGGT